MSVLFTIELRVFCDDDNKYVLTKQIVQQAAVQAYTKAALLDDGAKPQVGASCGEDPMAAPPDGHARHLGDGGHADSRRTGVVGHLGRVHDRRRFHELLSQQEVSETPDKRRHQPTANDKRQAAGDGKRHQPTAAESRESP